MAVSAAARHTLADKLNHLFQVVVPSGRGVYGNEEVAQKITEAGVPISSSYIWLLRKGQRDNPTMRHLEGLAKFFGVPPAYFFDDEVTGQVDKQLELLHAMQDSRVRSLALRAEGLSAASLDALLALVHEVRRMNELPPKGE
ncbi:transcriptional regulator [Streptomyces violaceoruber]|uniref:Transcriptional regulator n=1 Tax=Streptomyces violaceoruber TaxID=1935 RepID=A0A1V0UMH8_STRVN|nr:transcriptional regulator [Streptomyces violaceoruber]KOG76435.1 XRE family transcriptional regulator [Streptomyces griseus subsp. rhodochrous]MBD3548142.1 helix-turn-helix transcriptional regulator [Streptomyces sp. JV180]MBD3553714.1 helix-turn-helix transcriptional regulator [Streptomyces sp. SP18CM02]QSS95211.1 helix-turn-helix transcriptional regulator [Streptomyces sp. M54]